jgi:AraC-like DNA-binding protein
MSKSASIRASSLNGYRELVSLLGGDSDVYLRQVNIGPQLFENEFEVFSLRSFVDLLEVTARGLNCPDFGLRLAEAHGDRHLGPLGVVGANSLTVGTAMAEIMRNLDFHSPAVITRVDRKICPGRCTITWDFSLPGTLDRTQTDESGVGNIYQEFKILTQGNFLPELVLFRHSATKPIATYRKYFRSPVLFGQDINGVVVKNELMQRKIVHANQQLHNLALDYIKKSLLTEGPEICSQVRHLIAQSLTDPTLAIAFVADRLAVHERTLQRRLRTSGLTFEAILDSVREQRALELLCKSDLPMARIAELVGYEEQSSFSRACLRWFGRPPSDVRQHSKAA